ncbi:MAG: CheR family methyltransferase, partial [Mucilaginibacter sp.]
GCATGEEAYSLAIIVDEKLTGKYKNTVVKIFATDIDSQAMVHAGKGIYQPETVKHISPERIEKYFKKEGENYRVTPAIRRMVIFAQHDLGKNPPYCNMHFISCRNLLIYMTPVLQKKIFMMLLFGLKVGGYLFLGSSETPTNIINSLEVIDKKWRLYKSVKSKREVSFETFCMPEMLGIKRTPHPSPLEVSPKTNHALAEAMNGALAFELGYLAICVDENKQVLKSFGDTTKYLIQQNFNSNLIELLPKPLAVAFNTLSSDVLKDNITASVSGIKIKSGKKIAEVSMSVSPLMSKGEQTLLMVTLSEDKTAGTAEAKNIVFDEKIYHDRYTLNLEEELKETKEKLHTAYERLDASNENMQSFNEELISSNEEMQSTNEEMQSVNEELHTINADYQLKNKELLEVNDDLNNYFRSNINGQLFIDSELQLMKFSPGAVKQINLMESDIGRPLSHISTNIKFETIIEDIKLVLAQGEILTKEIETNNGKWYQIMTMPYVQQADQKRTGAIITFNDITELKKLQLELDRKNKSLLRINADLDNFIHAASHDLLAPLGNIETSINMMNKIALSDAKLLDFLNMINKSIKTYRLLITDIAIIAKVESDMGLTEKVNMDDLISNIEWSLEDKINLSGAIIVRDFEVGHLVFSKKNLRSILFNLIANAIKFRRDTLPVIKIRVKKEDGGVLLVVEDNGKGINKDGLDKIFDMYGRLNQDIEGSGIGLYLAKKIVNAAGGNMVVESTPGKGTKFMIYLPHENLSTTAA